MLTARSFRAYRAPLVVLVLVLAAVCAALLSGGPRAAGAAAARVRCPLDAKAAAIVEQLKQIEADRAKLAEAVEEDLLETYDHLFASKGDNAVVALEHDVCMGCHMKLTTQTSVRVKGRREVVHCEQCGRILYWSEG